jgi:hypothetical protein
MILAERSMRKSLKPLAVSAIVLVIATLFAVNLIPMWHP